jgi:hypothetical protein
LSIVIDSDLAFFIRRIRSMGCLQINSVLADSTINWRFCACCLFSCVGVLGAEITIGDEYNKIVNVIKTYKKLFIIFEFII